MNNLGRMDSFLSHLTVPLHLFKSFIYFCNVLPFSGSLSIQSLAGTVLDTWDALHKRNITRLSSLEDDIEEIVLKVMLIVTLIVIQKSHFACMNNFPLFL